MNGADGIAQQKKLPNFIDIRRAKARHFVHKFASHPSCCLKVNLPVFPLVQFMRLEIQVRYLWKWQKFSLGHILEKTISLGLKIYTEEQLARLHFKDNLENFFTDKRNE